MVPKIRHDVKRNSKRLGARRGGLPPAGPRQVKRTTSTLYKIGAPGVTRTPDSQFRKLVSVSEVLDITIAPSGLAGPRRAWTAAAASETRGCSAARGAATTRSG